MTAVCQLCHPRRGLTGTTGGIGNVSLDRIPAGERGVDLHEVSGGKATVGPPPREALLAELGCVGTEDSGACALLAGQF
jgi:hypothetical protein